MSSSTKSAAVVNYSEVKGSVEIREIPIPEIGEDDDPEVKDAKSRRVEFRVKL